MIRKRPRPIREDRFEIACGERLVPLIVRRHPTARRLILRVDPENASAVVTIPSRLPVTDGLAMANSKSGWILARLDAAPHRLAFADGLELPLGGTPVMVRHCPEGRRGVWLEDGRVNVSGSAEHLARRLSDWLRTEARRRIALLVADKTARLGRPAGRITIRDTRSRWGSCSARGDLSFCWRLVLVPDFVLDYVVAHEVAHIAEHNHGPRFWARVAELTDHVATARIWLKRHGADVRRYGR